MAAGGTTVGASSFNQLSSAEPFSRPFAAVICIRLMVMGEVTGRTEERPDLEASYYDNASTSVSSNRTAIESQWRRREPGRAESKRKIIARTRRSTSCSGSWPGFLGLIRTSWLRSISLLSRAQEHQILDTIAVQYFFSALCRSSQL